MVDYYHIIMKLFLSIALLTVLCGGIFPIAHAQTLSSKLSGRILLQVEQKGEAWYIDPHTQMRYFLSRPETALQLMRERGIGISDTELYSIPMADYNLGNGLDTDSDGLSDAVEVSMHTIPNIADGDGDGYSDKMEVINGFSPWEQNMKRLPIDTNFARSHAGKIFLQVQTKGEAWYINPVDLKRYYLGRPSDAFAVMRSLGLGISNKDLNMIPVAPGFATTTPSSAPYQGSDRFYLRVYNVDDTATARLNGNQIAMATFGGDTGFFEITKLMYKGDNVVVFNAHNNGGGYTWGFQIKKNDSIVFSESAGTSGVVGANNNDATQTNKDVYNKSMYLNDSGLVHAISGYQATSPASSSTLSVTCSNYDCFINSLNNNLLASGDVGVEKIDVTGDGYKYTIEASVQMVLKKDGTNYLQEQTLRNMKVVLSEQTRQLLMSDGFSAEEIKELEDFLTQDQTPKTIVCTIPTKENLLRVLRMGNEGNENIEVMANGDVVIMDPAKRESLGTCADELLSGVSSGIKIGSNDTLRKISRIN